MPPRGANAKKESGRVKKAENEAKKKDAVATDKEQREASKWDQGSKKDKNVEKEEKRQEQLARKAEAARLLAEEEASAPPKKTTPKKKKNVKPAGPGAISAGGGLDSVNAEPTNDEPKEIESFSATGIDNALDLLQVVNAKTDKASVGQQAAGIERHPERRFKGALEAYKERELPILRVEHPGLRLQQYEELLYKKFQKSPENPFNQTVVTYDATKEEKVDALKKKNVAIEERLKEKQ
ncbi:DUF1014-domain-containing protein [Thelephora terrestris]|uniref:DUF1014-domain-containing protein n=1 Tax=Thelephora terrestris TaxID=56493 RepID=A0A9P6LE25_9AGAM|nr:DUF1014-domain-containing protein [Thelephora terrestris]